MTLYSPTRFDPKRTGYRFCSWVKEQGLFHAGIDLNWGIGNQDKGQEVCSPTWSVVVYVSPIGSNGGLGGYVLLKHPHNCAYTRYMHLENIIVRAGETLYPKQIFAFLGKEGTSSPHLHFEVLTDAGFDFIQKSMRPFGKYTKGLSVAQVKKYWMDPVHWLETQEHFVGQDLNKKLEQVKNAIRHTVPPRQSMLLRLADRLQGIISSPKPVLF